MKLEPSIIESSELDSNIVEQEARSLGAIQLTPDLVRSAYMLFLDRNAESDVVVTRALSHGSVKELRVAMLSSSEFRRKNPLKLNNLPLDLPRLSIESNPEESAQIALFEHIQSKWTKLGAERPYCAGDIEMHCLPQRDVLNVVAEAGCVVCEVREDRSVNIPEYWISNTFVVEKR